MEKYYFEEKLEEGVLYQKCGTLTAATGSTEYNPVFPPGRTPRNAEKNRIPCLIHRCNGSKKDSCMIEAVSIDNPEQERKGWICISPILLEDAVNFFLLKNIMDKMTGSFKNYSRDQKIASLYLDFVTDNGIMIELKDSFAGINAAFTRTQQKSPPVLTPGKIMGYINILSIPKYAGNRMILLVIHQHGQICENYDFAMNGLTYESFKTGCMFGLEIWIASIQTDAEGISLLSYRCITEDILSDTGLRCLKE